MTHWQSSRGKSHRHSKHSHYTRTSVICSHEMPSLNHCSGRGQPAGKNVTGMTERAQTTYHVSITTHGFYVLGFSKPCPWAEGRPPAGSVLCLSFAGSAARALPSLPPLGPRPGRCSESRILDAGHPSLSLTEWRDGVKRASDRIYFLCKNVDRKAMCIFLCAVARLWK